MASTRLSREQLLAHMTRTHEKEIEHDLLGGTLLIREITAGQRLQAQEAASAQEPIDQMLYRAMLVQMSVVDPESGTTDASGWVDPRTRTPLLTVDDVLDIMNGRDLLLEWLVSEIAGLAALGPLDLKSGNPAADRQQRNTRRGAGVRGSDPAGDADPGAGDHHE